MGSSMWKGKRADVGLPQRYNDAQINLGGRRAYWRSTYGRIISRPITRPHYKIGPDSVSPRKFRPDGRLDLLASSGWGYVPEIDARVLRPRGMLRIRWGRLISTHPRAISFGGCLLFASEVVESFTGEDGLMRHNRPAASRVQVAVGAAPTSDSGPIRRVAISQIDDMRPFPPIGAVRPQCQPTALQAAPQNPIASIDGAPDRRFARCNLVYVGRIIGMRLPRLPHAHSTGACRDHPPVIGTSDRSRSIW